MLAADLVAGRAYAHRARPQDADCPLDKIIFVGPAKAGKAKIRHADGDLDGTVRDGGGTHLHIGADDDRTRARIDDHAGRQRIA